VLITRNIKVNLFYSSLALSVIHASTTAIVERLSTDINALHPLAIASSKPIRIDDFDRILD
jgi:hypothetical protein